MDYLLESYVDAKYHGNKYCKCPNCKKEVTKKSKNHVFCSKTCKDRFWTRVRGDQYRRKKPQYPGGYDQWKKDLLDAEGEIAEQILFEEIEMRYMVVNPSGQPLGVFHYEEDAEAFKKVKEDNDNFLSLGSRPKSYEVKEISVEDIHEYF